MATRYFELRGSLHVRDIIIDKKILIHVFIYKCAFLLTHIYMNVHVHVSLFYFHLFADLDKIYDAKLTKTLKKFTVKPITQVCVCERERERELQSRSSVQSSSLIGQFSCKWSRERGVARV